MNAAVRRVILPADHPGLTHPWDPIWRRGWWKARWLQAPAGVSAPFVAAYRLRLDLDQPATMRVHVSADERALFLVDGRAIRVLPERGEPGHWRYATYDLDLAAGPHWLALRLWCGGARAPMNQPSVVPGIIVAADDPWHDRVATGSGAWECRWLDAYAFNDQPQAFFTGARPVIDAARMPWGWETGAGDGFVPAIAGLPGASVPALSAGCFAPVLVPERLPEQVDEILPNGIAVLLDEAALDGHASPVADPASDLADERLAWQCFLDGRGPLAIPVHTRRRCLVDLGVYRSAWPSLRASGAGGSVALRFAEGLYAGKRGDPMCGNDKGDRRRWEGKYLRGVGPAFHTATGPACDFETVDWECGRWLEITVTAGDAPLCLERLELRATGYPFADEGACRTDDPRQTELRDLCLHTLRVGTHETYCDCPYYERLQYVGDTRLEVLATYCLTRDDRLPRQAIDAFSGCRLENGLVPSRCPARGVQVIPPFALWWIHMVHDHAFWRDDPAYIRRHLPGVRAVLEAWWGWRNTDGLVEAPQGWNFVDWVPGWQAGMPACADRGVSTILNWHLAWTLSLAAGLEESFGDGDLAALDRRRAGALAAALEPAWDPERRRWRDAPGSSGASEHGQILALLSGLLAGDRAADTARSLVEDADLAKTTIYFTHYLFEAYRLLGRSDLLFRRLGLWFDLPARGLTTTPESPEPTRSDCHPWGAHPLYHQIASLAGIRPVAPGFAVIGIRPQPGPLNRFDVRVPHPRGNLELSLERHGDRWRGDLSTPVPADTPDGRVPAGRHAVNWPVQADLEAGPA